RARTGADAQGSCRARCSHVDSRPHRVRTPGITPAAEVAMSMPLRRSVRLASLASLLVVVLTLPAPAQAPKSGGVLTIHPLTAPPSLSPHEESTIATVQPASACYSNLVYFDPAKKQESLDTIIPELAEKWSWQDNYRNLVFLLRRNVKWHDGKAFSSQDV